MNKKGVELSMNVIIIAAIALLVLIVLALIFTGSIGKFLKGNTCDGNNGHCVGDTVACDSGESQNIMAKCPTTQAPKCCVSTTTK